MAEILRWPHHVAQRCTHGSEREGACCVLFTCAVCGCSEGEVPTECPGERLHPDERAAIYNGHIDFRGGQWVARSVMER